MRRLRAASFSCQWKKKLGWEQGSRVAVLLENRWNWDRLPEKFRENFIWYYDVLFLEADMGDIQQKPIEIQELTEKLLDWQPEALVAVGNFCLLQRILLLRAKTGMEEIPVLLFSDGDRWQSFFQDDLWIRGRDGETEYWGYVGQNERDALVITEGGEFREDVPDAFAKELYRFRSSLQDVWESGTIERDLCYELAEPLRVLYGIPMETGSYFSLLYLYRLLSRQERERVCRLLGVRDAHADWRLEGLAKRYRRGEMFGILLSERDVPLLTQMAMEGIENYPVEMQPGWEQVEAFYREWCR